MSEPLPSFAFAHLDLSGLPSPVHITDEFLLEENLKILAAVSQRTGSRILLALKAFAQFSLFPLIRRYLQGATASSLFEARMAYEELGAEVHACAPAYPPEDFPELMQYADHIVFNSFQQWRLFQEQVALASRKIEVGIRINPEHSEVKTPLYDPCAPGSRLGVRLADFSQKDAKQLDGLHFHSLCELGADSLERTWQAVEAGFGQFLADLKWINLGGGQHITQPGYDQEALCSLIERIHKKYKGLSVYLEPGEAVALRSGVLAASVLDIVSGGKGDLPAAILDISATAHIPDVLEMPYRPQIFSNGSWAQYLRQAKHSYRLGGLSCLAGDVIGDYSFSQPLSVGQRLFLDDMAHYTMVKNSNFNGIRPPAIAISNTRTGAVRLIKQFQYEDYKSRLS